MPVIHILTSKPLANQSASQPVSQSASQPVSQKSISIKRQRPQLSIITVAQA